MDPVSTTLLSTITSSLKLAEYGLRLADASEDKRLFCKLIERVHKDRAEAMRERREKAAQLRRMPSKKAWIDGAIADTDHALADIGRSVEPGRFEENADKGLSLKQKFEWVFVKNETLLTKQMLLAFCHQTLSIAIGFMQDLPATDQEQQLQLHEEQPLEKKQQDGLFGTAEVTSVSPGLSPRYTYPGVLMTEKAAGLRGPWARRPVSTKDRAISESAVIPGDVGFAKSCSEELERIMSNGSSLPFSNPQQPQWDEISDSKALGTTVKVSTDADTIDRMTKSRTYDLDKSKSLDTQDAPRVANDRRRRNEARFGGGSR